MGSGFEQAECKKCTRKKDDRRFEWDFRHIRVSTIVRSNGDQSPNSITVCFKSSSKDVFCAGADLKERINMSIEETEVFVNRLRATFQRIAVK